MHMKIPVNAIAMASMEMEMGSLIELFRLALCRALKAVTRLTESSLKVRQKLWTHRLWTDSKLTGYLYQTQR